MTSRGITDEEACNAVTRLVQLGSNFISEISAKEILIYSRILSAAGMHEVR